MYHKVEHLGGTVRVVESHTDELKEAAIYGVLGLWALDLFVTRFAPADMPATGAGHYLWLGAAMSGVVLLWLGFSQGLGRLMRGWIRGEVIEVDLRQQRFRRFRRRFFFKKDGGEWLPMGGAPQGAKIQGSAKTRAAIRVGGERDFVFPTEPGELDDDTLYRFVQAINQQLQAKGISSREIAATQESRPMTWRLRLRKAWEFGSVAFMALLFFAFVYGWFAISGYLVQPPNPS